jgi:hypothetical protein
MPINTHENYIEIGTSVNADNSLNNVLVLPAPIELPSTNEFLVDGGRNANAEMLIQMVGRTQYKTEIKFGKLKNKKWWEINRWFDTFGYVFFMKYFSHTEGMVKIQKFYRGNMISATPSTTLEKMNGYSVPTHYYNGGFSVIDIGEESVIIVSEMAVN